VADQIIYFADENSLGLGKLLRASGREDVLYPGHDAIPEVPRAALDTEWMAHVGRKGYIVLTRDRRILTRPIEAATFWEHGVRAVLVGAKQDLTPQAQVELFLKHEPRLLREITKRGPGPWALAMNPSGLRPMNLKPPLTKP